MKMEGENKAQKKQRKMEKGQTKTSKKEETTGMADTLRISKCKVSMNS